MSEEKLKKREIKELNEKVSEFNLNNLLNHEDFKFIGERLEELSLNKIIYNTTSTSPILRDITYRKDNDSLIIKPYFERNDLNNTNIFITKETIKITFLNNSVVNFLQKNNDFNTLLVNSIKQILSLKDKTENIKKELTIENEKTTFLKKYGILKEGE